MSLLFLLYLAVLFNDNDQKCRFGYADDLTVVKFGHTAAESVVAMQEELDVIVHRAKQNMIDFDTVKLKLLVIVGGPRKKIRRFWSNFTGKRSNYSTATSSPMARNLARLAT